ncbi:hypothetical protein L228DRAFT_251732 [Xylona heveae TC161]|uniref:Centrosomin N-terminal motif 1 domain-containing protein n=1 Tax=Xylona heveae (strain CBS 132557 / TC161) TaxID=1328760 RepID=A0A164ZAH3_XYLHT|nr:hypothetical protein L228DRAFT_251732 [Xylona heveae TC161]KZF18868.1 hypothetical protein L228DRAFT_251732 [Xylona heveae TC161]
MVVPVIDTPRTEAGNATYLNSINEPDFSIENSFRSPSKEGNDLLKQIQASRAGMNLKTPRSRGARGQPEFTPLLKSATRNNIIRRQSYGKGFDIPQTPAFLKPGYQPSESPALPMESSGLYDEQTRSSFAGGTPLPHISSSSAASTPIATLPRRDAEDVLANGANAMTLKEQENIINRIEKDNFGLKLKIHFLEDALRKAGPGFSEAALKENTELKVNQVTLQKELHQYRKTIRSAEHELETYKQDLMDMQERMKRKYADAGQREELERLREEINVKNDELADLRQKVGATDDDRKDELEGLRDDIREKDAEMDELKDELEDLRERQKDELEDLRENVSSKDAEIEELRQRLKSVEEGQEAELEELENDNGEKQDRIEQLENEKEKLQERFKRMQMDDRQQLEKFATHMQATEAEVERLRIQLRHAENTSKDTTISKQQIVELDQFRVVVPQKDAEIQNLRRELTELEDAFRVRLSEKDLQLEHLGNDVRDRETRIRELKSNPTDAQSLNERLGIAEDQRITSLKATVEEKEAEIKSLKNQVEETQSRVKRNLDYENQRLERLRAEFSGKEAENSDLKRELRDLHEQLRNNEVDENNQMEVEHLRTQNRDKDAELSILKKKLQLADSLFAQLEKARTELEETQSLLQEKENAISRKQHLIDEMKSATSKDSGSVARLQEELATAQEQIQELQEQHAISTKRSNLVEQQRHQREIRGMEEKINELSAELEARHEAWMELRSEVTAVKKELASSKRQEVVLQDQIQGLEDEVEILELNLEEEVEKTKDAIAARHHDAAKLNKKEHARNLKEQEVAEAANRQLERSMDKLKQKERRHQLEQRGLMKSIHFLNAKCARLEGFRADLAYSKEYYQRQIDMYNACNKLNLKMIAEMGIVVDVKEPEKKLTFRVVARMVQASVRMKKLQEEWSVHKQLRDAILAQLEHSKRKMRRGLPY